VPFLLLGRLLCCHDACILSLTDYTDDSNCLHDSMGKLCHESNAEGKGKKKEPAEDLIRVGNDLSPRVAEEPWELSY
jgi:hypothetical protein